MYVNTYYAIFTEYLHYFEFGSLHEKILWLTSHWNRSITEQAHLQEV